MSLRPNYCCLCKYAEDEVLKMTQSKVRYYDFSAKVGLNIFYDLVVSPGGGGYLT